MTQTAVKKRPEDRFPRVSPDEIVIRGGVVIRYVEYTLQGHKCVPALVIVRTSKGFQMSGKFSRTGDLEKVLEAVHPAKQEILNKLFSEEVNPYSIHNYAKALGLGDHYVVIFE